MEGELLLDPSASFYSMLLELRESLRNRGERLVLAESCTSGLVAAEIGKIPGISEFFCGSMVVYRTQTKTDWLEISPLILKDPAIGPVSLQTTVALAGSVLARTPEATLAAAITGHLGPGAPKGMDGKIFCALEYRNDVRSREVQAFELTQAGSSQADDIKGRAARQQEAVWLMLNFISKSLRRNTDK